MCEMDAHYGWNLSRLLRCIAGLCRLRVLFVGADGSTTDRIEPLPSLAALTL
jgi:hypothetical protein